MTSILVLLSQLLVIRAVQMSSVDIDLNIKYGWNYADKRPSFKSMVYNPKYWLLWTSSQWDRKYGNKGQS